MTSKPQKPILCLDFDGVCHSYTSPWENAWIIPDPPVPGLFEFLEQAQAQFVVAIYSSRSLYPSGREAMRVWLANNIAHHYRDHADAYALSKHMLDGIEFPYSKPAAFVSIDDRAITFKGEWPDIGMLRGFVTWNQHLKNYQHKRGNVEKAANPMPVEDRPNPAPAEPPVPDVNITLE